MTRLWQLETEYSRLRKVLAERDLERLNMEWFRTLAEATVGIAQWTRQREPAALSLTHQTPEEFTTTEQSKRVQLPKRLSNSSAVLQ